MKASIIIPVKNGMPYLPETLAALLAQTYRSFEVLVVDDGCTDGTRDYVSSLNDDRVLVLRNDGAGGNGAASAFNYGLARATGELLTRCDADDLYPPRRLEEQV